MDKGFILAAILSIVMFVFVTWNYFSPLVAWYWPLIGFLIVGGCVGYAYSLHVLESEGLTMDDVMNGAQ